MPIGSRVLRPKKQRRAAQSDTDVRRAHRLLLTLPFLTGKTTGYSVVLEHKDRVAHWHREHTGWKIEHNLRSGVIRLVRRPARIPSGVWDGWRAKDAFTSPRDYAFFVYLLWYARTPLALERNIHRQVELSRLKNQLATAANAREEGRIIDFAGNRREHSSLMRALRALEYLGAVKIGDEETAGKPGNDEDVLDALITFTDVATSLTSRVDLGAASRVQEMRPDPRSLVAPLAESEEIDAAARLWRSLLVGPVLLRLDDPEAISLLDDEDFRDEVSREASSLFGLSLDHSHNYARLVRTAEGEDDERATPLLNPYTTTSGQAALLLCECIRTLVEEPAHGSPSPDEDGCVVVSHEAVVRAFREVVDKCGGFWAEGAEAAAQQGPSQYLIRTVYPELRRAGLLRGPDQARRVLFTPVAPIYSITYVESDDEDQLVETTDAVGAE